MQRQNDLSQANSLENKALSPLDKKLQSKYQFNDKLFQQHFSYYQLITINGYQESIPQEKDLAELENSILYYSQNSRLPPVFIRWLTTLHIPLIRFFSALNEPGEEDDDDSNVDETFLRHYLYYQYCKNYYDRLHNIENQRNRDTNISKNVFGWGIGAAINYDSIYNDPNLLKLEEKIGDEKADIQQNQTIEATHPEVKDLIKDEEADKKVNQDLADTIINHEVMEAKIAGEALGFLLTAGFSYFFKCPEKREDNPLYRAAKTASCLGQAIGILLGLFLPIPFDGIRRLFSGFISLGLGFTFGLLTILCWPFRKPFIIFFEKFFPNTKWQESWTKYVKTALVTCFALGGTIGGVLFFFAPQVLIGLFPAFYSGLGAAGQLSFAITAIANAVSILGALFSPVFVAGVNRLFPSLANVANTKINKDDFRNNYLRTCIFVFQAIGAVTAYFLYNLIIGGALSGPMLMLGAAVGGVVGALSTVFVCPKISQWLNPEKKDSSNSWDYGVLSVSNVFTLIGYGAGYYYSPASVGVQSGIALIGPTLFSNLFGIGGALIGFVAVWGARKLQPVEQPADKIPWSQRIIRDSYVYGLAFGTAALVLTTGPLAILSYNMVQAVIYSSSIGAAVGGVVSIAKEPASYNVWVLLFNKLRGRSPASPPVHAELEDKFEIEKESTTRTIQELLPTAPSKLRDSTASVVETKQNQAQKPRSCFPSFTFFSRTQQEPTPTSSTNATLPPPTVNGHLIASH